MTLHNQSHHCLESRRSVPQPVIPAKAGTQDAPFRHCLENRLLAEVVSHANRHSRESGNPGIGVRPPIFVGCGVGRGQHGGLLRKTPPVCGRGRAGAAKRGGGEAAARKLPLVTAKPPIVVGCGVGRQPHMRDSRESGNPGRPSPSFPRRREPRSAATAVRSLPLPSAGADAQAQRRAREETPPPNNARHSPLGGGMRSEGNPGETRRETYGGFPARHYNVRWLLTVG